MDNKNVTHIMMESYSAVKKMKFARTQNLQIILLSDPHSERPTQVFIGRSQLLIFMYMCISGLCEGMGLTIRKGTKSIGRFQGRGEGNRTHVTWE